MPDPATPRQVLARYHRAMLDASADDLADLYATDAVHHFPFQAPGFPDRYVGREQVRAGYRRAWADRLVRLTEIHDVVVHQGADPEVVVGEFAATGTVRPAAGGQDPEAPQVSDVEERTAGAERSAQPFRLAGLLILRVRDGVIVEVRDYMDALGVARQLGRLPA